MEKRGGLEEMSLWLVNKYFTGSYLLECVLNE